MTLTSGQLIFNGDYRIEELIGEGAFAEVYKATDLTLKRACAVKVLRSERAGVGPSDMRDYATRFRQEAQLGAKINNPNVIQVYRFYPGEDMLALAMEYAPGGSLEDRLKDAGKLSIDETLRMALEIARGLAAIHERDVVHRDLKPSNILFDAQGHAKVGDLGLAHVPGGPSMISQLGSSAAFKVVGTPGYMSPEQEGGNPSLKPPSDVYALGVVLFEMLTLRNPTKLKPGTRVKGVRADVPAWLDELLTRMLADDWKERPWDGAEVVELLRKGREDAIAAQNAQDDAAERGRRDEEARQKAEAERQVSLMEERRVSEERQRRDEEAKAKANAEQQARLTAERKAVEERASQEAEQRRKTEAERAAILELERQESEQRQRRRAAIKPWLWVAGTVGVVLVFVLLGMSATSKPQLPTAAPPVATIPVTIASKDELTIGLPGGVEMVLVRVQAGEFLMGSADSDKDAQPNEQPQHKVTLDEYWIGKTEVTNAQFSAFVSATGYKTTAEISGTAFAWTGTEYKDLAGANWRSPQGPGTNINGKENYPVVSVSWDDAVAFGKWVTEVSGRPVRLPTEAEWEKAARGASTGSAPARIYPWGDDPPNGSLLNYADKNFKADWADKTQDDGYELTAPVGSYPKGVSPYGALDMAGNVWEWTADWYAETYYASSPEANPQGPASGDARVLRGGGFLNVPRVVRAACRNGNLPYSRVSDIGFRLVASPI